MQRPFTTAAWRRVGLCHAAVAHTGRPVPIECQLAHDDFNPKMREWGKKIARVKSRPPIHP